MNAIWLLIRGSLRVKQLSWGVRRQVPQHSEVRRPERSRATENTCPSQREQSTAGSPDVLFKDRKVGIACSQGACLAVMAEAVAFLAYPRRKRLDNGASAHTYAYAPAECKF
jgi:hypothetical protein